MTYGLGGKPLGADGAVVVVVEGGEVCLPLIVCPPTAFGVDVLVEPALRATVVVVLNDLSVSCVWADMPAMMNMTVAALAASTA